MRRATASEAMRGLALALLCGVFVGCGHARATDAGKPEKKDEPEKKAERETKTGGAPAARSTHRKTGDPNTDEMPIAASPEGLLKPGGARQIQQKLADAGLLEKSEPRDQLDGPTREALRKFQAKNDMPTTGLPDQRTVRKLGLDPEAIFRRDDDAPKP